MKLLLEEFNFECDCPACNVYTSTLFPLLKDQTIDNNESFQKMLAAGEGIETWNRKKIKQKYLQFMKMLQNVHTPYQTHELSFLHNVFQLSSP